MNLQTALPHNAQRERSACTAAQQKVDREAEIAAAAQARATKVEGEMRSLLAGIARHRAASAQRASQVASLLQELQAPLLL